MLKALFGNHCAIATHHGWPLVTADADSWRGIGEALREGKLDLLALWGDDNAVQCTLYEPSTRQVLSVRLPVCAGRVPSLAQFHAPASRLERAITDLFGIEVVGLPDHRPWLDHGRWPRRRPLAAISAGAGEVPRYAFLPAVGPHLHQIPVGPVHAGIIEPGHFRFTASGETVVRLEERLGYTHKGIEWLLRGKSLEDAARIAARGCGDSTVGYSFAFARAVEAALEIEIPPRARWLRAIMAELERIANHLGDVGAICNDAAFSMMHAECGILREHTLRACAIAFGHRLMMDRIVPGGVAVDLEPAGLQAILALTQRLQRQFPELVELYDNTASLQDRTVGSGSVSAALAAQFAAPGYVGRASGRTFDARTCLPYPPYDRAPIKSITKSEGDVDARIRVRIFEIEQSRTWLEAALAPPPPPGPLRVSCDVAPVASVEGAALVEGFRGDILAYVRLDPGLRIERGHLRDPSWFLWPLLEAAIEGNIVADFPLINKSFNCAYSGNDL
ncbi:MAG TPA: nickel-dependent hydrogenase large subunit [Steroidobacteraceae bacterium]|nr:nickel-dependent hydrogenase large subunit [Steroidobacteraceae bacterium]